VFSEQTVTFALHNVNSLVFITEVESVYSAVWTESLYNTNMLKVTSSSKHLPVNSCTFCKEVPTQNY